MITKSGWSLTLTERRAVEAVLKHCKTAIETAQRPLSDKDKEQAEKGMEIINWIATTYLA